MASNFPDGSDSFPSAADLANDTLATKPHSTLHGNLGDAMTAVQDWLIGLGITPFIETLLDDASASAARATLDLGTLATQNGTFSGTSSGTNTGDQTITLTGDVTGSGTGSFTATIANDAVTYAKMQNVSETSRVWARKTSGAGNVEECSISEVLEFLGSAAEGHVPFRGASSWASKQLVKSGAYGTTLDSLGQLAFYTDSFALNRFNGSDYYDLWGPSFYCRDPQAESFAWINQGGATTDTTKGGVCLCAPTNGNAHNLRIQKKSAPSTPYTIILKFLLCGDLSLADAHIRAGAVFRQSSDGKLIEFGVALNGASASAGAGYHSLFIHKFNSPSSYNSTYLGRFPFNWPVSPMVMLRIADDGANRKCSISADGQGWQQIHSVGRTDFLTADEVGFYVNPFQGDVLMTLLDWSEG